MDSGSEDKSLMTAIVGGRGEPLREPDGLEAQLLSPEDRGEEGLLPRVGVRQGLDTVEDGERTVDEEGDTTREVGEEDRRSGRF